MVVVCAAVYQVAMFILGAFAAEALCSLMGDRDVTADGLQSFLWPVSAIVLGVAAKAACLADMDVQIGAVLFFIGLAVFVLTGER